MQLHRRAKEIEGGEARLVLIGQATPRAAAHFRRKQGLDLPVLADEKRVSYRAAGLRRGSVGDLLSPSVVTSGIAKAVRTRQLQGRPVGDVAQLGGAHVIAPGGRPVWSHVSQDAADNPGIDEIAGQLRSAG
ncbi:MAG TPA: AhpC/TSA family protein [Solirubrobacteraceae bacterium]|nr:AhpC/TSA family protein [Solirubrobacteraceae bacterium]